jgi:phospholipid/cholesterol/gamma-HCH transport system permease protein
MTSRVSIDGLAGVRAAAFSGGRRGALRVATIPSRSAATTGRAIQLLADVLRYSVSDSISLRIPVAELMVQAWTLLKVTVIPAMLMAIPFGAMVSVVASGLVNQVGANALIGAASGVGVVRQGAPITAGLLMAGAAGSAIASDFGARAVREELDALRVIGVDPIRALLVAPILIAAILATGTAAAFILAMTVTDIAPGSYWQSFGTFAKLPDLYFTMAKTFVFGGIVAIVSTFRGLEARGGPKGVADAVNASVVINVILIVFANLAITQLQTMFFPLEIA